MTTMLEELDELFAFEIDTEIIGKDSRVAVGKKTGEAPFRYICSLEYDKRRATGVLIGPRTVLTAGHNVHDITQGEKLRDPSHMMVIPGRNAKTHPPALPTSKAVTFIPYPGYARGTRTDLAIVHLEKALGATYGYWSRTYKSRPYDPIGTSILRGSLPLPAGTLKVNLSGYPGDKGGVSQWRAYDITVSRANGLLRYLDDTYRGHSGSPVWVRRSPDMGGRVLVGVHIGGNKKSNAAVFVDKDVLKFIIANTK